MIHWCPSFLRTSKFSISRVLRFPKIIGGRVQLGNRFVFVRACARAVWLPSGIGSQKLLVGVFPFPLARGRFPSGIFSPDTANLTEGLIRSARMSPRLGVTPLVLLSATLLETYQALLARKGSPAHGARIVL